MNYSENKDKFYSTKWFLWLMIIFMPYVGLGMLLFKKPFNKNINRILIIYCTIVTIILSISVYSDEKNKSNTIVSSNIVFQMDNTSIPKANKNKVDEKKKEEELIKKTKVKKIEEKGKVEKSSNSSIDFKWNYQEINDRNSLINIKSDSKKHIICGYRAIFFSDNGLVWVKHKLDSDVLLTGIASNKDLTVVVGYNGTILTSKDGISWTETQLGQDNINYCNVIWNDKKFIIVGDKGTILTSSDGKRWVKQSSKKDNYFWNISWDGKRFFIVGDEGTVLMSDN